VADEKRVRSLLKQGTLGSTLTAGGTTIDFGSSPGFATLAADEHLALIVESEVMYLTAYTSAGTTGTVARAQEGTSAVEHASGTAWMHGPTVRDYVVGPVYAQSTVGQTAIGGTSWAQTITLEVSLPAYADDIVLAGASVLYGPGTGIAYADIVSKVSTTLTNSWGTGAAFASGSGAGLLGLEKAALNAFQAHAASVPRRVQAGDLSAGVLTLAMVFREQGATNVDIWPVSSEPMVLWAVNYGPEGTR
jgi:hypothetical protein